MNMWNRFKYRLLRWLMDDICEQGDCNNCWLYNKTNFAGTDCYACHQGDVFRQARKVWGI